MKLFLFFTHKLCDFKQIETNARELDLEEKELSLNDPVIVKIKFHRDGDVIRLHCDVCARVIIECVRCLEEFRHDVDGDFSLVARRLRKGESLHDYSDYDSDKDGTRLIFVESDTNVIDIGDFVRDTILLSIPMKPVCRETCRGLCSVCGKNLNYGECGCKRERFDHRFEELTGLFDDKK